MVKSFFVRGVVDGVIKFLARGKPNGKNLPIQEFRVSVLIRPPGSVDRCRDSSKGKPFASLNRKVTTRVSRG